MSGDLNKPVVGDAYAAAYQSIRDNFHDSALMYDNTSTANPPTGTVRWTSATNKWEKYSGAVWGDLSSSYAINISGNCTGTATTATSANALNTANSYQMTHLGVGLAAFGWVVPSADVSAGGIYGTTTEGGWIQNSYYDGAWKYKNTNFATWVQSTNGIFTWNSAVSGTAGTAITWVQRMQLDASGNLTVLGNITANGLAVGFRNVPRVAQAASDLTHIGKCMALTTTQAIPVSVFATGDELGFYNDSAAAVTLTLAAGTLRLAGTTTVGTRTVAARGFAYLWFNSGGATPEIICSGNVT